MFTLDQIAEIHSRVKTGADFPKYIQEMKVLGVLSYDHFVSDGHIQYFGTNNFSLKSPSKWDKRNISENPDSESLKNNIAVHQQGQTDYPTFCMQSAESGVEKWIVDLVKMKCIYLDKFGNEMLIEPIPEL